MSFQRGLWFILVVSVGIVRLGVGGGAGFLLLMLVFPSRRCGSRQRYTGRLAWSPAALTLTKQYGNSNTWKIERGYSHVDRCVSSN